MGDPNVWGPDVWDWLLSAAYHASSQPRRLPSHRAYLVDFCEMVLCLEDILPCRFCRESFRVVNELVPVTQCLAEDVDPVAWVYEVHNIINIKLEKPCFPYTSLQRKLNVVEFSSVRCAAMVFVASMWADEHCTDPASVPARKLDLWFERVVRLARADPYLVRFNDAMVDVDGSYVSFVESKAWVRDRLSMVLNDGITPARSRASYEAAYRLTFT